jgi:ribosomal protein S18 acetylase RimI-like enzyme
VLDNCRDAIATREVHLAFSSGTIVGALVLKPDVGHFKIKNIAAPPEYQGCGIGRLLLEHAQHCTNQSGHSLIHLYTLCP